MRRNEDPFKKYERIKWIRERHNNSGEISPKSITTKLKTAFNDYRTIKAADIFNALPIDKQDELKEWFKGRTSLEIITI